MTLTKKALLEGAAELFERGGGKKEPVVRVGRHFGNHPEKMLWRSEA